MSKKMLQEEYDPMSEFWESLKSDKPEISDLPAERRGTQWSAPLNKHQDKIGFFFAADIIQLYIRSGVEDKSKPPERTLRMEEYSQRIREQLSDQQPFDDKGQEDCGASIRLQRSWARDDKAQWPDTAQWVQEQFVALQKIIIEME